MRFDIKYMLAALQYDKTDRMVEFAAHRQSSDNTMSLKKLCTEKPIDMSELDLSNLPPYSRVIR